MHPGIVFFLRHRQIAKADIIQVDMPPIPFLIIYNFKMGGFSSELLNIPIPGFKLFTIGPRRASDNFTIYDKIKRRFDCMPAAGYLEIDKIIIDSKFTRYH